MKAKVDYAALDKKLLRAIASGKCKFAAICLAVGVEPHADEFREVDRRLQALKKRGLIEYKRGSGWGVLDR